ncbi:hypothetical protein [Streptomyces sp. NPDC002666]
MEDLGLLARLTSAANDTDVPERLRDLIPQPREVEDGQVLADRQAAPFGRAPTAADHLADAPTALNLEDADTFPFLGSDPGCRSGCAAGALRLLSVVRGEGRRGGVEPAHQIVSRLMLVLVPDGVGELLGQQPPLADAGGTTIADLDAARTRLLAGDAQATCEITNRWHTDLYRLLQTASVTSAELHEVLTSLRQLINPSVAHPVPVHNNVNGGVQHGPVIQSGRITELTFHVRGTGLPVVD